LHKNLLLSRVSGDVNRMAPRSGDNLRLYMGAKALFCFIEQGKMGMFNEFF